MQLQAITDEGMIARIQQGETSMLENLIRRYYDDVYHFWRYKTGDMEHAYDCAQETFLRLTRYIHTYGDKNADYRGGGYGDYLLPSGGYQTAGDCASPGHFGYFGALLFILRGVFLYSLQD